MVLVARLSIVMHRCLLGSCSVCFISIIIMISDVRSHSLYSDQGGSLANRAVVAQALGHRNILDLMFDGKLLDYPLFINNFRQCQQMINDPATELDLQI